MEEVHFPGERVGLNEEGARSLRQQQRRLPADILVVVLFSRLNGEDENYRVRKSSKSPLKSANQVR